MRRPRLSGRATSIRARLAIRYAVVAFLTGAALLAFSYVAVRREIGPGSALETFATSTAPSRERRLNSRTLPSRAGEDQAAPAQIAAGATASTLTPQARALVRERDAQALQSLLLAFAGALAVMTLVSSGLGWLLAGRALAPVARITETARRVSQRSMHERIALEGPDDELRQLADTFDGMLESLEKAFQSERRFVANASHEMRTPLAVVRTALDVSAEAPPCGAANTEMRQTIYRTLDAAEHLVERLLLLAQSRRGLNGFSPVDLNQIVDECSEASSPSVELLLGRTSALVNGDAALLKTLVTNLIDNAVRYGESVKVAVNLVSGAPRCVQVVVENGGAWIPLDVVDTLLQPFARGNERTGSGTGLGLSIVEAIATEHGGSTVLYAPASGGLRVTVSIPACDETPDATSAAV